MIVAVLFLSLMFGLILIGLSVRANARFRQKKALPMRWLISTFKPFSATVTRSAPRVLGLSLVPFLAICVLSLITVGAMTLTPRPGQEWTLLPSVMFLGSAFVAVHIFYLWLVEKTLQSSGS